VTLAEDLSDWTDDDVACFKLGVNIGLFDEDTFQSRKGLFWTDNPVGNGLYKSLVALADAGVLDRRDGQFRWVGLPSQK
jgi:hypothetical protein